MTACTRLFSDEVHYCFRFSIHAGLLEGLERKKCYRIFDDRLRVFEHLVADIKEEILIWSGWNILLRGVAASSWFSVNSFLFFFFSGLPQLESNLQKFAENYLQEPLYLNIWPASFRRPGKNWFPVHLSFQN